MKLLNLQEFHGMSLDILKDIDAFCRPRNIHYSLAFGTLLGAVRHKGFIPWDDDIDLVMPREDYERFSKEYRSEKYIFIDRATHPECYLTFGRVADREKTFLASTQPWHSPDIKTGVWVDVFPMDAVPDNREEYLCLYRTFNRLLRQIRKARRMTAPQDPALPLSKRITVFRHQFGHHRARTQDPAAMAQDFITTVRDVSVMPTRHIGLLSEPTTPAFYFEKSVFEEFIDLPFEDGMFPVPSHYDEVLRATYGDYMQLPPENKRKVDLFSLGYVYWKD